MRNPKPIADNIDNNAGNPRQQRAANIDPAMPTLSAYRCQNNDFFEDKPIVIFILAISMKRCCLFGTTR
jgi:hypothetical protein